MVFINRMFIVRIFNCTKTNYIQFIQNVKFFNFVRHRESCVFLGNDTKDCENEGSNGRRHILLAALLGFLMSDDLLSVTALR